ncbi:MAG: hypothetical protein NW226_12465 [Microscillaceae bacterium]|nr:hypothetical protein [Microscillaceae bacterium]
MKSKIISLLFGLSFLTISLGLFSCEEEFGPASIRIENNSEYDFEKVVVRSGDNEASYGTIKSGQFSGYRAFPKAYRYAYVELSINKTKFVIQPIDYVGANPLKVGEYTYRISVLDMNTKTLKLDFIEN